MSLAPDELLHMLIEPILRRARAPEVTREETRGTAILAGGAATFIRMCPRARGRRRTSTPEPGGPGRPWRTRDQGRHRVVGVAGGSASRVE